MIELFSPKEIRSAEKIAMNSGVDEITLMERAALGIFEAMDDWITYVGDAGIGILCGKGNNAGDGYALAHLLHQAGKTPILYCFSPIMTPAAAHYFELCQADGISVRTQLGNSPFADCALLVDCLFGIGFRGEVESPWKEVIEAANQSGLPIVAADIPSGLNAASGQGSLAVCASRTVAIGGYKHGHFLGRGRDVCGESWLAPIGLTPMGKVRLIESKDIAPFFAPRPHDCHKGSFGTVTLLGGCLPYSGAPKLSALASAALRSGCGIARLAVPSCIVNGVLPYLLETTLCPMPDEGGFLAYDADALQNAFKDASAGAVGMGMGQSAHNGEILTWILKNLSIPMVIDADGLNTLASMEDLDFLHTTDCTVVLTPHPKEFSRLSGLSVKEILSDPITHAKAFAAEYDCILLLKGTSTVITDGTDTFVVARGCGGMATAGSGDVLSGVIASLLAWNHEDSLLIVSAAAHLCGLAGEIAESKVGSVSMVASDTVGAIPEAIRQIVN